MTGVSGGPVGQQAVTANSGTTTIDLSSGNLIYMTQSANTTVAFANTEGNTDVVYLVRVKDATATERTITWPSGFVWNGGTEPTLLNINDADEGQIFKLTTRDNGATWYGVEVYNNPAGFRLFGVGLNGYGLLGQNNTTQYSSPVQVGSSGGWHSVKGHGDAGSVMATKTDGTLWSWGYGRWGSMIGSTDSPTQRSSPIQIPGTTWKHGMTTNYTSMATKTDGTLWAWGYNVNGALGHNNRTDYSSPVQIPGTTWSTHVNGFCASYDRAMAIKTDGTLWAMGDNESGALGLNQAVPTKYSSPTQIPGTTWSQVAGGQSLSPMALKTDGTIWAWGLNDYGGLAQNNTTNYSSPVQIGSGTNWVNIANGSRMKGAVNTSGELWVWGRNEAGQLGQNSKVQVSSPIQIPGTNWALITLGHFNDSHYSQAVKTDGTLWAWGYNPYGTLGHNNLIQYSSPVQIGTDTTWNTTVQGNANVQHSFFNLKS
jgi:alpha-tubulin suppressor-like RCC1 family protein